MNVFPGLGVYLSIRITYQSDVAFPSSISLDQSEEQQESFLKELPKKCLFLAYEDPYRRCVSLAS